MISIHKFSRPINHAPTLVLGAVLCLASPVLAQQDVRLGIRGYVDEKINIAIDDLTPTSPVAQTVVDIISYDLDFSLRFNVLQGQAQAGTVSGSSSVDYESWAIFGTEYLVTGVVAGGSAGYYAEIAIHHVPFQRQIENRSFALPDPGADGFRAAVHEISNHIIQTLTGEQGIADTRIAFASRRPGDKEIYVIDYDGYNPYRVTKHDTISMTPNWNPNGKEICYMTFVLGDPDLYCSSPTGGRARTLSAQGGLDMAPGFSPDGRKVALTLTKDGNAELYVLDVEGRSLKRLTYSFGIDTAPDWSPNGREIVFESDRTGISQLYVIDADGANLRQLTFGGEAHSPDWSPLGDRIAYTERIEGRFQLATIRHNGGERTVMTSIGDNEDPTWSPDGLHFAFSSTRGGAEDIWTMDWDGRNMRQVTRGGGYVSPNWSPRMSSARE